MKPKTRKLGTMITSIFVAVMMVVCSMSMLVGCGGSEGGGTDVGTIELSATTLTLLEGQTSTLVATTSNDKATVTWSTADRTIATVSRGRVTGVKEGNTTIKASISDEVFATCSVTVNKDTRTITISQATATVDVATETSLTLTATPSDGSAVEWTTSDSTIATVNAGVVTFKKTAQKTTTVTITASIANSEISTSCVITVNNSAIPDDYAALAKNGQWKEFIESPEQFTYFYKSAHANAGRVTFVDSIGGGSTPYIANGAYVFEASQITTVEGDDTQYELRYHPGAKVNLEAGDVYTVTFKIDTNVAGDFRFTKGSGKVEGKGSNIADDPEAVKTVPVGETTVTLTNCLVDDFSDENNIKGLSVRPMIFSLPAEGNLLIKFYDFQFTKTGHEDSVGGEIIPSDTYTMSKIGNDENGAKLQNKWGYGITSNSKATASGTGSSDGMTVTFSGAYTSVAGTETETKVYERIYYNPAFDAGTTVKVSFKIAMSVAGSLTFDKAAKSLGKKDFEANVAQDIELTYVVQPSSDKMPFRFLPIINVALADGESFTITVTEFSCVEVVLDA